jgi:hypothetical protein
MIVGHALLAFALVATLARRWVAPERAVMLGLVGAAFAVVPDVDMAYAVVGVWAALTGDGALLSSFWDAGLVVHRGMTHSLPVGAVAAFGFACFVAPTDRIRLLGVGLLVGLVALAASLGGPLSAVTVALYCLAGVSVAVVARHRYRLPVATIAAVALVALLSHPFGDLLTGQPPALLFPLDVALVTERVVVAPDPTVHLLATFMLEVAAAWLAVIAAARLRGWRPTDRVTLRIVTGLTFGAAVLVLTPPTLAAPYVFTALVLALGGAVAASHWAPRIAGRPGHSPLTALLDGTATVTLALAAYGTAYVTLAA